ncbi:MAG: BatD family protein [Hymenobacteraceae bacterium]|nr:BatD family protein [Hymenobacteraceae bacterium]
MLPLAAAYAQQISIEIGKTDIPINQYFTVSVVIQNEELKEISRFPEIDGFKKSSRYTTTSTRITGTQKHTVLTIVQNYAAIKEGEYKLKPFSMKVNGQTLQSQGATITVGPMSQTPPQTAPPSVFDMPLLDDVFGEDQPQEYIDKKEDAFLTFSTEKESAFVGEGVHVALDFYVAAADVNLLEFYDYINQIPELITSLKPKNVWEEAFDRTEVIPQNITIEDKEYLRFRLYEAVYYPLNTEPLLFQSVGLKMIKYKVAKNPSFFGQNVQQDFKTYYTKPKIINIKELPPHPLKDVVPVGNYRLREGIDRTTFETNKSFNYLFEVEGEGNLTTLQPPQLPTLRQIEFYTPEIRIDKSKRNGRVIGRKSFRYYAIAKEAGEYNFGNYFNLIFFNPDTERYDTLRSDVVLKVTGESDQNAAIQSRDMGEFYNIINNESNDLVSLHRFDAIKLYTNIVILLLIVVSLYVFLKK